MHSESQLEQFVVFKIAQYHFALPIGDVLQVVTCPPQTSQDMSQLGFVQLGQHIIRVVDLHSQCHSGTFAVEPGSGSFLVLTPSLQGGCCGILVYEPPDLMEFSVAMMRPLPRVEPSSGVLRIASHAAVFSHNQVTTTVFLLDLPQALASPAAASPVLPAQISP